MYIGVDVGSVSTNAVLIDNKMNLIAFSIVKSGFDHRAAANEVIANVCGKAGICVTRINDIVSTGYGRRNVPSAGKTFTEITCHSKGINFLAPEICTVIDIGGQDSKVIRVSENGFAETFSMNDKCAAGTGRFLEVMALTMGIEIDKLGALALASRKIEPISSICTVFAESEVVSKIADGKPRESIAAGIHQAICERLMGMITAMGIRKPVALTGGVAKNNCIRSMLSLYLGETCYVPEEPQIVGALGAAILACNTNPL